MKKKFWTIQSDFVVDMLKSEVVYYPDVSKSRYILENNDMRELYSFVVNSFNKVNQTSYKGLLFSFLSSVFLYKDRRTIFLNNIEDFTSFITSPDIIGVVSSMWKCFPVKSKIIEIEMEVDFNPLYIDFNDYQIVMPNSSESEIWEICLSVLGMEKSPSDEFKEKLLSNLKYGIFEYTPFACGLIQAHLPYIRQENIVNVHPLFEI